MFYRKDVSACYNYVFLIYFNCSVIPFAVSSLWTVWCDGGGGELNGFV